MEINLLPGRQFEGRAEVHKMPGPAKLGKVAGVFQECVPVPRELPVHQKSSFACQVPTAILGRPIEG